MTIGVGPQRGDEVAKQSRKDPEPPMTTVARIWPYATVESSGRVE
jgi:hypothetical protein